MKHFLRITLSLMVFIFLMYPCARGQILTFEFSGLAGDEVSATSNFNTANLSSATITRGSGLTASSNAGRFNGKNWALTSIANAVTGSDYMEFTITPDDDYQFSVSSIYIQMVRSGTGPRGIAIRSSVDNYASNLDQEYSILDNENIQNFTFSFSQSNSSTAVTYRIYMWAESTAGTGGPGDSSGDDIIVYGTTTFATEPTNHPLSFSASANSSYSITTTWSDNDGAQAASGFLILANTSGIFTDPVDGTSQIDDTDLSDNSGLVNVAPDVETYTWNNGLNASTPYYFKIFAYTGSGTTINYKTVASVPTANATTGSAPQSGDVIITEVMQNPAAVGDADGEWFEIYNTSDYEINIDGWTISDLGSDSHTINNGGPLTISSHGYLVLGDDSNISTNGGYNCDYEFSSITLGNTADKIILTNGGTEINRIEYDGGPTWPDPTGATMSLNPSNLNGTDNNTGSNWYAAKFTSYGDGDKGTPGSTNDIHYTTWTGSTSTVWDLEGNWDSGIPSTSLDAIIPNKANDPSVGIADQCFNVLVENGTYLTISSGNSLSVFGTIKIEDGGSFINNGTLDNGAKADASAMMQRSIPAYSTGADGWHLLASPVNNMTIAGSDFAPGNNDDLYSWDEVTWYWLNYKEAEFTNFTNGVGYLCSYETLATKDFNGTFNNSDITFSNLSKTTDKGEGWHLFGNPFQSALHWTEDANWALSNVATGAKIMNSGGSYTDITSDGANQYIPANQGFYAQVTVDANNNITIPKAARDHNSTAFYKNEIPNLLTLKASDGEFYVETWLQIIDGATFNFDEQYDIRFLGGMYHAPYLYFTSDDEENLSTNRIGSIEDDQIVQMGFKTWLDREFVLTTNGLNSFDTETDIILEDLFTNTTIDLRETSEYSFIATTGDETNRFKIHFLKSTGIEDIQDKDPIAIYSDGSRIFLNSTESLNAKAQVFNTTGQMIFERALMIDGLKSIDLKGHSGWFVVRVISNNVIFSKKVFVY